MTGHDEKSEQLIQKILELQAENKRVNEEVALLKEQQSAFGDILDSLQEVVFQIDCEGNLIYFNRRSYGFFGFAEEHDYQRINVLEHIALHQRPKMKDNMRRIMSGEPVGITEYLAIKDDGTQFPVMIHSVPVTRNGVPIGLRGIIMDISERIKLDDQLKYLSAHDSLTGVYNRVVFEREMLLLSQRTQGSLGLIISDLDGLKLVNDTLGHDKGDVLLKAAVGVIKQSFADRYFIARIGGDEFAILLPNCTEEEVVAEVHRLREAINQYNQEHADLILNLSIGYSIEIGGGLSSTELFKRADNVMHREKLHRSQSVRSYLVHTLLTALEARDIITERHADRMEGLIEEFAQRAGISEHKFNDLRLFAHFHDIGKVGISDKILQKPGALLPEERREMQNHCDIGHRIALSSPDLLPIADWILKHHEWWNGQGYPLGLAGQEIPLECRILNILDAFDAMTSDRPYRKALPVETALEELNSCAGTQFDPDLVKEFLNQFQEGRFSKHFGSNNDRSDRAM
ncbi:MAG: HD domain-containing phosphohydrolase [Ignavibacteriales bacterium]